MAAATLILREQEEHSASERPGISARATVRWPPMMKRMGFCIAITVVVGTGSLLALGAGRSPQSLDHAPARRGLVPEDGGDEDEDLGSEEGFALEGKVETKAAPQGDDPRDQPPPKGHPKGDNCEGYFRGFGDCEKENLWTCRTADWSWGYVCCCLHGFGNFTNNAAVTTGMISWNKKPALCIDTSTPYSLGQASYTSGPMFTQVCKWGDPNKQFHLPRQGKGTIRWASHPDLCVAVKDGMNSAGELLSLQDCKTTPSAWTHFEVRPVDKQIAWAAHRDKCLRVSGDKGGSVIEMRPCSTNDANQQFDVIEAKRLPEKDKYPRLFCVSLMLPFGSEVELMKFQFTREIGIFDCPDAAIYSNKSFTFTHGERKITTNIMPGSLAVKFGGKWKSALNTDIFIRFWGKVVTDPRAWRNHWTVKLDPDCVFFPSRLQQLARSMWMNGNPDHPVFLNNCHLGMHGPIEAINRHALGVYKNGWAKCKNGEPYKHKQEDFYLRRCWRMLGIKEVDTYNLMFENAYACDERASTRDGRHPCFSKQVSFHPFKTAQDYWECYRRGATQAWAEPLMPLTELPGHSNHHHG